MKLTETFLFYRSCDRYAHAFYDDDHENCIFLNCMIVLVECFYTNVSLGEHIAIIMSVELV